MTITINLTYATGVNFNAEFKSYFNGLTPNGFPYILGGNGTYDGDQIVILGQIDPANAMDTKALILDGKNFNYYFNSHTLSGTMMSIRLSTLGSSYDSVKKSFAQDGNGHIANVMTTIEITGLNIHNEYNKRGDFHNTTYALMGGGHSAGGSSNPSLLENLLQSEAHLVDGSFGGDTYKGTTFDDTVTGNGGDDILDGNLGTDTAVFSGNKADYIIADKGDGSFTVTDRRGNIDGVDTLRNFEFAKFADETVKLASTTASVTGSDASGSSGSVSVTTTTGSMTVGTPSASATTTTFAGTDKTVAIVATEVLARIAGSTPQTGTNTQNAAINIVQGTDGNDILSGDASNDILIGGRGENRLDGGAGFDFAAFGGAKKAYDVSKSGTSLVVKAIDGNSIDTLVNVERLSFADGTLAFDLEGIAGQAYRLYKAAFDRAPDVEGLGFWIRKLDSGNSMQSVTGHYVRSAEFAKLYGTEDTVTNHRYVDLLYKNALGRQYEEDGYNYWVDKLNKGEASREYLLSFFSESNENKASVASQIYDGILYV